MIRFIAAIDIKNGIADDNGLPWQGKIPSDVAYFRKKTLHSSVMMGSGWYSSQRLPLPERRNLVASSTLKEVRDGFELIKDAREFLKTAKDDVWVGGGAGLFASTLDLADELYLTRIEADFKCTKFFPPFENKFELTEQSDLQNENGISYRFEIWKPKLKKQG